MARLCIDIGNTFEKLAVFDNGELRYYYKIEDMTTAKLDEVIEEYDIKSAILSSTKIIDPVLREYFDRKMEYIVLDHLTPLPITNSYETPETLGRDRIAAAVGAHVVCPDVTCVIINAGTCITADVLTREGEYLGGNITPGIWMRLKAMHHFTDKLPSVDLVYHDDPLGKSTTQALQNGAVRGAIWEMQAFIDTIEARFGTVNVILAGGDTNIFADHLKCKIFARPDLVFIGLNEILRINA